MKAKKLAYIVLPLMLFGVGCSKDDVEKKKTESLQVAEADKKDLETVNKELDKLVKEKAELQKQKEEVSKGKDTKVADKRLKNVKAYQEAVDKAGLEFAHALQGMITVIDKDKTLITTQDELRAEFKKVKVPMKKLQDIKPPEQYDGLQNELTRSMKLYNKAMIGIFDAVDQMDDAKKNKNVELMDEGLRIFGKALDDIRALDEQNMSEVQ